MPNYTDIQRHIDKVANMRTPQQGKRYPDTCLSIGYLIIILASVYAGCGSMTSLVRITKVDEAGTMTLSDGRIVRLVGIKTDESKRLIMTKYITNVGNKYKVIAIEEEGQVKPGSVDRSARCYIYVWGMNKSNYSGFDYPLLRGFADVRDGLFNRRKGIAVNLNALLIREGISSVDESCGFSLKGHFLKIQQEVQRSR